MDSIVESRFHGPMGIRAIQESLYYRLLDSNSRYCTFNDQATTSDCQHLRQVAQTSAKLTPGQSRGDQNYGRDVASGIDRHPDRTEIYFRNLFQIADTW